MDINKEAYAFEAYHIKNKKMYPITSLATHGTIKKHELLDIYSEEAEDGEAPVFKEGEHFLKVRRLVGKDSQGEDIYTDDICTYTNTKGIHYGVVCYVDDYSAYRLIFKNGTWVDLTDNIVRRGNIYEQPELIKETK